MNTLESFIFLNSFDIIAIGTVSIFIIICILLVIKLETNNEKMEQKMYEYYQKHKYDDIDK